MQYPAPRMYFGADSLSGIASPRSGGGPLTAMIVEPALPDAIFAVSMLSSVGFHVTVAESFLEARAILNARLPALLVTEIQLGAYNGLHLVVHGTALRPDMATVVTACRPDHVLRREAERMGATFVLKPTTDANFLAAVVRTLAKSPGTDTVVGEPFERRARERRSERDASADSTERRQGERREPLWRVLSVRSER